MRSGFVVSEASAGLRRNLTMTIAAVMTVAISVTLLGIALIIRAGANQLETNLINQIRVSVYLNAPCGTPNAGSDCLTAFDRTNIQKTLQSLPQVKSTKYIPQEEAWQIFKREFANEQDLVTATKPSQLPESFAVQLNDPHDFGIVKSAVSQAPGVQSVSDAKASLQKLFTFFRHLTLAALVMTLVLLASTCLLIYNTMRVAAFSRRRETSIMRLVGASDFYIQAPFVLEGAVAGIAGSVVGLGFLAIARWYIASQLAGAVLTPFGEWATFGAAVPLVLVVGILLPAIASLLTLQRHLRV
jgi:cell division transport system permease protein